MFTNRVQLRKIECRANGSGVRQPARPEDAQPARAFLRRSETDANQRESPGQATAPTGPSRYETNRKLHFGKNEWHETTLIYRRKENSENDDHRQYSVFMSNPESSHLMECGYRRGVESGYRSIKQLMSITMSKNFGLRFFYFASDYLLYSA